MFDCVIVAFVTRQTPFLGVRHHVTLSYNYYVNKQSTQLSIYHLMQHVRLLKGQNQAKILVIKYKNLPNRFFVEFRTQFYKLCLRTALSYG